MVITKKLRTISNTDWIMEVDDEELDDAESEAEGQSDYIDTASRWFEGLINKDVGITKEVYSIHNVEFDRQEMFAQLMIKTGYALTLNPDKEACISCYGHAFHMHARLAHAEHMYDWASDLGHAKTFAAFSD
ncbi:hypothetical protein Syun_007616 [Stephania yunnanensis]|uniref:Uncharacterized protein n=1 Tax=Stephania yunnanensis TaxID=152371 RepID=A0AAP0PZH4_9MAGN